MQESLRRRRANKILRDLRRDWWLYLMLLPGIAYITIFKYVPMYGVTIAFKKYKIKQGIIGNRYGKRHHNNPFQRKVVVDRINCVFIHNTNGLLFVPQSIDGIGA